MEEETNKGKLEIFKYLRDSVLQQGAEFISAMKTVQNPTIFVKMQKKKKIEK